jgi:8-oxo-dGTP pyrophosphatase MutT (NUDIX family)
MTPEPEAADAILGLRSPPRKDVAAALLVDEAGRYLLQRRDSFEGLPMPGHWGVFGGGLEPGETPEAALRREVFEELSWHPRAVFPVAVSAHAVWPGTPVLRKHFFLVPFHATDLAAMVQREGAGQGLFRIDEACRLERIVPWDLCGMLFHAHHRAYWPERPDPDWLAPA